MQKELNEINKKLEDPEFWQNRLEAAKIMKEKGALEEKISKIQKSSNIAEEASLWIELLESEEIDQESIEEIKNFIKRGFKEITEIELSFQLQGEDDSRCAILAIHPGAGGTESQDWAEMLLRMYMRWAQSKGFKTEILDILQGDEAGIKSVTISVKGRNAFGFLKGETGVHRLVRISPFDASKRRHTSFASVYVYPEIEDEISISIEDKDLRIDTFRASGAGGQHVNKTESAVRITHIPTGIVVTCQNERSQIKNRQIAMKILKAKLYQLEKQKREEELAKKAGEKKDISWGNQIRSYILHPYKLVKDHRTNVEIQNAESVLDGNIDQFIEAWLKQRCHLKH